MPSVLRIYNNVNCFICLSQTWKVKAHRHDVLKEDFKLCLKKCPGLRYDDSLSHFLHIWPRLHFSQVHCHLWKRWRCSDMGKSGWRWPEIYHRWGEGVLSRTQGPPPPLLLLCRFTWSCRDVTHSWCVIAKLIHKFACIFSSTEWQTGDGKLQQHGPDPHVSWWRSRRHPDPVHHQRHTRNLQQHRIKSRCWIQVKKKKRLTRECDLNARWVISKDIWR